MHDPHDDQPTARAALRSPFEGAGVCKTPTIRALRKAGFPFRLAGHFVKPGRGDTVVTCVLHVAYGMPGLDIWAIDGSAVYVGDTRSVRLRNQTHGRYQGKNQQLCQRKLRTALARGKMVKIYVLEDLRANWNGMTYRFVRASNTSCCRNGCFRGTRAAKGFRRRATPAVAARRKLPQGFQSDQMCRDDPAPLRGHCRGAVLLSDAAR